MEAANPYLTTIKKHRNIGLNLHKILPTSLCAMLSILLLPALASAAELSGGVSLGGFQVGTIPSFAISPHIGLSWRIKHDFVLAFHDLCSILPPLGDAEIGIFNKASMAIGYALEKATFSAGPAFSFYYVPACGRQARPPSTAQMWPIPRRPRFGPPIS